MGQLCVLHIDLQFWSFEKSCWGIPELWIFGEMFLLNVAERSVVVIVAVKIFQNKLWKILAIVKKEFAIFFPSFFNISLYVYTIFPSFFVEGCGWILELRYGTRWWGAGCVVCKFSFFFSPPFYFFRRRQEKVIALPNREKFANIRETIPPFSSLLLFSILGPES